MKQLKMYLRCGPAAYPEAHPTFRYRACTAAEEDVAAWLAICKNGLLGPDAGTAEYRRYLLEWEDYRMGDTFFATLDGEPVATMTAIVHPQNRQGYVHMVAAKPECRGRGVGGFLNRLACARFWERGCQSATLTTDDPRVPAIKSYLSAGFLPVDWDTDMTERWEKLLTALGRRNVEMVDESGKTVRYLLPDA